MPARTPSFFRIALFWLGLQAVWGALLGISLQARVIALAPGNALVEYSHLAALGALVAAVVQIVVGPWSDARRGRGSHRIEFYAGGTVAGAAAVAWFYLAPTYAMLVLAYVALQLALNVAIGPYQAIIPDLIAPQRTGAASSWMAALQSVGNAVGAVFASLISDARWLAGSLDALLLGACAVTCAHVRALDLRAIEPGTRLRITRAFVDLFISRALIYVGFFTLVGYLLFYVRGVLGVTIAAQATRVSGLLILAFTLVGAAGAALAARPSDRLDKRLVATIGGAVFIAGLTLFITTGTLAGAVAATVVAGLGWGVFLVADWALGCRVLPPGALATTMGIWNLALIVPQMVAPFLTATVLTHFPIGPAAGLPREAFALAVGETFLGICWLWRLSRCTNGE
jgi:MFS family permease